jgi:hypothetical protein
MSHPEKTRPNVNLPASVSRKASIPGERYSLKNSTAVAMTPDNKAIRTNGHCGARAEKIQKIITAQSIDPPYFVTTQGKPKCKNRTPNPNKTVAVPKTTARHRRRSISRMESFLRTQN